MSTTATYWPPEGEASFVSHDDEVTWTPLCNCGRETYHRFTPWGSWHCDNFDAHGSLGMRLMLDPEDWPDYEEEDYDYCDHDNLIDADGTVSCDLCDYCPTCDWVTVWDGPECSVSHDEEN